MIEANYLDQINIGLSKYVTSTYTVSNWGSKNNSSGFDDGLFLNDMCWLKLREMTHIQTLLWGRNSSMSLGHSQAGKKEERH